MLHVLVLRVRKQPGVLANGVRCSLEPFSPPGARRLRRSEDLHASDSAWNKLAVTGDGPRSRTSTKPSPPKRMPLPKLYVRAMCRFSDVELNWRPTSVRLPRREPS